MTLGRAVATSERSRVDVVVAYTATLVLSAALLFVLEPMFAKMVLPLLGGSPAVWTTAVLFFQAVLLAGYAFAHWSVGLLGVRRQASLHLGLMALALILLPIALPAGWAPPATGSPVLWLLGLLAVGVGLPFFVVSTMGPLLQRWFSATDHPAASDPYFLFRASNAGSLLGLLAYPILIEPRLALPAQARAWSIGYMLLVALTVICAVALWRSRRADAVPAPRTTTLEDKPSWARRAKWVLYAFVPSSLMLGVTAFLTADIAPVPLLWLAPLGFYLLSFVVVFSPRYGRFRGAIERAFPILALVALLTMWILATERSLWFLLLLHLTVFTVAALAYHGRLAADRPAPVRLTEFYLWIGLGGVLGGVANAFLAPIAFDTLLEYPLVLAVSAALLTVLLSATTMSNGRRLAWVVVSLALPIFALELPAATSLAGRLALGAVLALGVSRGVPESVRNLGHLAVGIGVAVIAMLFVATRSDGLQFDDRSFFGAYRVVDADGRRVLYHGVIAHGAQNLDPARATDPIMYFTREGPVGDVVRASGDRLARAGVIGLGTGSMACFAEPGEEWVFFEIDPLVVRIASDPDLFTYLSACAEQVEIVVGDGRQTLAREPASSFDLLVVDAFSGDAIPMHLLTREAFDLYLSRLQPDGLLALHISNRYLDLAPVVGRVTQETGATGMLRFDRPSEDRLAQGATPSIWVVIARDHEALGPLQDDGRWAPLEPGHDRAWTDDYSSILDALRWG